MVVLDSNYYMYVNQAVGDILRNIKGVIFNISHLETLHLAFTHVIVFTYTLYLVQTFANTTSL